jgi:hypothetical protein
MLLLLVVFVLFCYSIHEDDLTSWYSYSHSFTILTCFFKSVILVLFFLYGLLSASLLPTISSFLIDLF